MPVSLQARRSINPHERPTGPGVGGRLYATSTDIAPRVSIGDSLYEARNNCPQSEQN